MTTFWVSLIVLALGIGIGAILSVIQSKRRERLDSIFSGDDETPHRDDEILGIRKVSVPPNNTKNATMCSSSTTKVSQKPASAVQVINVMAKKPHQFSGYELLQTLLSAGLRYGDMKIFHRHQHSNGKGPILFSLASVAEPGTFDMQTIGEFTCPGVTLFMQLSNTPFDEERYQLMLATAEQLAEELEGVVCDQSFTPLVQETDI